ncbi:helix-hairpin-helix domain-containing protein [Corynebacterium heidelbergense]|nr:helix-hairpin-helix domain-containing protein [Corynebacterium heidelbergense]
MGQRARTYLRQQGAGATNQVRNRVEALAQPMPGHEIASVDVETRATLSPLSAKALVLVVGVAAAVVFAIVLAGFFFSGEDPGEKEAASGAGLIAAPGPGGSSVSGASNTGEAMATLTHSRGGGNQDVEQGGPVVVAVQGMVARPGLLTVDGKTRVGEVLERAGGTQPGAVVTGINLAELVSDGLQIVVDDRGSSVVLPGSAGGTQSGPAARAGGGAGAGGAGVGAAPGKDRGLVNLNTADATLLQTLEGVGPATAQAIITWREANGGFRSVEQLMEVRGIGPAKFEAMRSGVTV